MPEYRQAAENNSCGVRKCSLLLLHERSIIGVSWALATPLMVAAAVCMRLSVAIGLVFPMPTRTTKWNSGKFPSRALRNAQCGSIDWPFFWAIIARRQPWMMAREPFVALETRTLVCCSVPRSPCPSRREREPLQPGPPCQVSGAHIHCSTSRAQGLALPWMGIRSVHRDLKLANVLLARLGAVKISTGSWKLVSRTSSTGSSYVLDRGRRFAFLALAFGHRSSTT